MKKRHARLGALLLTGALAMQLSAGAFAAQPQAQIGNVQYQTLSKALEAVQNGQTIEVLTNVSNGQLTKLCDVNGQYNITLDLNGHTISEATANSPTITFTAGNISVAPSLTIRDGSIVNTAVCESTPFASGIWVESLENAAVRPIVNLTNVTVSSKYDAGVNCIDGYLQVNGAKITGYDDAVYLQDAQMDVFAGVLACNDGSDVSGNGAIGRGNSFTVNFTGTDGLMPTNWQSSTSITANAFIDVASGSWYYDSTYALVRQGIVNGTSVWTFSPNNSISRAEFITLLARASGQSFSSYSGSGSFSDVGSSAWYNAAVGWGVSKGIITGYGNGKFGPTDNITREQMATMLLRFQQNIWGGELAAKNAVPQFTDTATISSWATEAVLKVAAQGIINGSRMSDGSLQAQPRKNATRAEACKMLHNMLTA